MAIETLPEPSIRITTPFRPGRAARRNQVTLTALGSVFRYAGRPHTREVRRTGPALRRDRTRRDAGDFGCGAGDFGCGAARRAAERRGRTGPLAPTSRTSNGDAKPVTTIVRMGVPPPLGSPVM